MDVYDVFESIKDNIGKLVSWRDNVGEEFMGHEMKNSSLIDRDMEPVVNVLSSIICNKLINDTEYIDIKVIDDGKSPGMPDMMVGNSTVEVKRIPIGHSKYERNKQKDKKYGSSNNVYMNDIMDCLEKQLKIHGKKSDVFIGFACITPEEMLEETVKFNYHSIDTKGHDMIFVVFIKNIIKNGNSIRYVINVMDVETRDISEYNFIIDVIEKRIEEGKLYDEIKGKTIEKSELYVFRLIHKNKLILQAVGDKGSKNTKMGVSMYTSKHKHGLHYGNRYYSLIIIALATNGSTIPKYKKLSCSVNREGKSIIDDADAYGFFTLEER